MIEDGKPIGVVLTMEEYELLRSQSQTSNIKSQTNETNPEAEKLLIPDLSADSRFAVGFSEARASAKAEINNKPVVNSPNLIGEAIVKEIDFPEASASIDEINLADAGDVTLEDLGLDPDMQLPKDF